MGAMIALFSFFFPATLVIDTGYGLSKYNALTLVTDYSQLANGPETFVLLLPLISVFLGVILALIFLFVSHRENRWIFLLVTGMVMVCNSIFLLGLFREPEILKEFYIPLMFLLCTALLLVYTLRFRQGYTDKSAYIAILVVWTVLTGILVDTRVIPTIGFVVSISAALIAWITIKFEPELYEGGKMPVSLAIGALVSALLSVTVMPFFLMLSNSGFNHMKGFEILESGAGIWPASLIVACILLVIPVVLSVWGTGASWERFLLMASGMTVMSLGIMSILLTTYCSISTSMGMYGYSTTYIVISVGIGAIVMTLAGRTIYKKASTIGGM